MSDDEKLPIQEERPRPSGVAPSVKDSVRYLTKSRPASFHTAEHLIPETQTATADEKDPWEQLYDGMVEYDTAMLERWKGTMDNLLIFAGLFSAVVTAFIIESYSWLSQDSGDATVQLLLHLSAQMAAGDNSVPAANPTEVLAYKPSPMQIRVNIFWFLSLSISLIAALFAILVQQWLQNYSLRGGVSAGRVSVRIRHFRFKALNRWGVPDVVAILPVFLQSALVLFFIGLINLLWDLSQVIAITITIFLCLPILFFLGTAVLPVFYPSCPYKSPLATMIFSSWHILVVVVNHTIWLLAVVLYSTTFVVLLIVQGVASVISGAGGFGWEWHDNLAGDFQIGWALPRWEANVRQMRISRKRLSARGQLSARDINRAQKNDDFDKLAVAWAPNAISSTGLRHLDLCLADLKEEERSECVLQWAEIVLNFNEWNMQGGSFDVDRMFFQNDVFVGLDPGTVVRLRNLLLKALPSVNHAVVRKWFDDPPAGECMHLVLRQLVKSQPDPNHDFIDGYFKVLVDSLPNAKEATYADGPRIVSRCFFEAVDRWADATLNDTAVALLVECVLSVDENWRVRFFHGDKYEVKLHDAFLCMLATVLRLKARRPETVDRTEMRSLIAAFSQFVEKDKDLILRVARTTLTLEKKKTETAHAISTPVWMSLITSLVALGTKDSSLLPVDIMHDLITQLTDVFSTEDIWLSYDKPLPLLRTLEGIYPREKFEPDSAVVRNGRAFLCF